jgi:hypothetical protein
MRTLAAILLSAALVTAANLPKNSVRGNYVEARTADVYTGPCFAMSEINLTGDLAVMGWQIERGSFDGVTLDGLSVVGVVRASATLGDTTTPAYPVKSVIIVDERASLEQRLALQRFAQRMAGDLLQDVVRVEAQPITFDIENNNIHSRNVKMAAGTMARIETLALSKEHQICHNEAVWYTPLTKVDHAMAAYTQTQSFQGEGLNTRWNYAGKRGSFVGTFQLGE